MTGALTLFISSISLIDSRNKKKRTLIDNTMSYFGISEAVKSQLDTYYDYLSIYKHPGSYFHEVVSNLPRNIDRDIYGFLYKSVIEAVPFFQNCEVRKDMAAMNMCVEITHHSIPPSRSVCLMVSFASLWAFRSFFSFSFSFFAECVSGRIATGPRTHDVLAILSHLPARRPSQGNVYPREWSSEPFRREYESHQTYKWKIFFRRVRPRVVSSENRDGDNEHIM